MKISSHGVVAPSVRASVTGGNPKSRCRALSGIGQVLNEALSRGAHLQALPNPAFLTLMIGNAMNRPVMEGLRLNTPAYVRHARLIEWVAQIAALTEAREVYWCDG